MTANRRVSELSVAERINLAKQKTQRLVDHAIELLGLHESNRIIVYSSRLSSQIQRSFAAHAFNQFQRGLHSFELIRLSALWDDCDPFDLDKTSIPAVVNLIEGLPVLEALQEESRAAHASIGTVVLGYEDYPPDIRASIENELRDDAQFRAGEESRKARVGLETALRWSRSVTRSPKLQSVRNHRDKYLAHSIETTRREKRGPVAPLKFGYERPLLWKSIGVVDKLHFGINGAGFAWKESVRIARQNAEALWYGCIFKVLE